MAAPGISWRIRHELAMQEPKTEAEHLIVGLINSVGEAIRWFQLVNDFPDAVGTPAFGAILEGIRDLLNFDVGRLDAGTVDDRICRYAEAIGWDLDMREIVWEGK